MEVRSLRLAIEVRPEKRVIYTGEQIMDYEDQEIVEFAKGIDLIIKNIDKEQDIVRKTIEDESLPNHNQRKWDLRELKENCRLLDSENVKYLWGNMGKPDIEKSLKMFSMSTIYLECFSVDHYKNNASRVLKRSRKDSEKVRIEIESLDGYWDQQRALSCQWQCAMSCFRFSAVQMRFGKYNGWLDQRFWS